MRKIIQKATQTFLPAIYLIWAGLILGVSFIATPVKFQAPNLTMSVALEVGKATFHLFNLIEWGLVALLISLTALSRPMQKKWLMVALVFAILTAQTFWLLPVLNIRADAVIAGQPAEPGHYHWFYIIAELLKLFVALFSAWVCSGKAKP